MSCSLKGALSNNVAAHLVTCLASLSFLCQHQERIIFASCSIFQNGLSIFDVGKSKIKKSKEYARTKHEAHTGPKFRVQTKPKNALILNSRKFEVEKLGKNTLLTKKVDDVA